MNIITQEIINDAKNLIERQFIFEARSLFQDFIEQLFYCHSNFKYTSLILSFTKKINYLIISTLEKSIKTIDNLFAKSMYRKKNFYINKQNVSRTIVDCFGTLSFSRNYYTDKNKRNGFFFIDNLFGFEQYKTYSQLIRALLIKESTNSNVNKACNNSLIYNFNILDNLKNNNVNIPRQTVYNWIKNLILPKVNYEPIETNDTLYVMADEKWIHEQIRKANLDDDEKKKKHFIMSKCFVIFTGASKKNNRTKLLNRHVFITSSKTPWKDLMDEICKIYDFENIKTINLLSDAGNWILAGASELKLYSHNKIVINTCEFHVIQKVHRITTDSDLREKLIKLIYEDKNKNEFIKVMNQIIESKPKRKEKLEDYKNYIVKHWKSILNMSSCSIKSSMESHISHCVAEHFGSRPKGFSKDRIENYLKLEEYKQNGINILDIVLKCFSNDEGFTYNEKEVSFSMFDKDTSLLPICTSKNPVSIILNKLAYS